MCLYAQAGAVPSLRYTPAGLEVGVKDAKIEELVGPPLVQGFAWVTGLSDHAFNFSTEQPMSVIALVRRILAAAGRADLEPVILGEATNEIPEQHLSAAKASTASDRSC